MSNLVISADSKGKAVRSIHFRHEKYPFLEVLPWEQGLQWQIVSSDLARTALKLHQGNVHMFLDSYLHGGLLNSS